MTRRRTLRVAVAAAIVGAAALAWLAWPRGEPRTETAPRFTTCAGMPAAPLAERAGVVFAVFSERDDAGIHVASPEGAVERLVGPDGNVDAALASADGAAVAYTGTTGLRLLDRASGRDRSLSHGGARSVAWSPNGRCLAFAAESADDNSWDERFPTGRLYVIELERGSRPAALGVRAGNISWSPDGSLAYDNTTGLYILRGRDGPRRLVPSRNARLPVWSPNGRAIAYLEGTDVLIADANGAKPRRVGRRWSADSSSVSGVNPTLNLSWSPDGGRLAYVSRREGPEEVFVVAADGSGERRLTTGTRHDDGDYGDSFGDSTAPIWDPAGTHIVFLRDRPGARDQADLWIMRADGSGARPLTSSRFAYVRPPGGWVAAGEHFTARAQFATVRPARTVATARVPAQLSADGGRVGYATSAGDDAVFGLWEGPTGAVAQVPHPEFDAVHGELDRVRIHLSGDNLAVLGSYGESEPDGVQTLTEVLWLAAAGTPKAIRAGEATFEVDNEADVYPSPGDAIPAFAGDAGAVVYSSGGRLRAAGADAARDLGAGEIVATGGPRLLARVAGRLTVVENGVAGRRFPAAPVAVLDGDLVITLGGGRIVARAVASGRIVHSYPLALETDAAATLDVSGALATYVRDGQVHVLRLSDGRTVRVALPAGAAGHVEAEIEPAGLFVSYGVYRRDPGRIAFYPYDAVAVAVDRGS